MKGYLRLSLRELLLFSALVACFYSIFFAPNNQTVVTHTGRELDVVLLGDGYFCVTSTALEGDFHYTRRGRMVLNANRQLILDTGAARWEDELILEPSITLPEWGNDIRVSPIGRVECRDRRADRVVAIGEIQVVRFQNPAGLKGVLPGVYRETSVSGPPDFVGHARLANNVVKQGWIESVSPTLSSQALCAIVAFAAMLSVVLSLHWMLLQARRTWGKAYR
jgi:flagellar basal-body rod protein FlgG